MQFEVKLNNAGYDPYIDFMKGMSILWVVLTHSISYDWQLLIGFPFWGAQAVPLFLLIQCYHYFKRDYPTINFGKLLKRIVLPFAIAQVIILVLIIVKCYCYDSGSLTTKIMQWFVGGGAGPGSFYFWIYLQFAVLLPCVGWIQSRIKLSSLGWLIVFAIISELLEVLCSIIDITECVYRLCAIRYVFLIYGGYLWARDGIKLNWLTAVLAAGSLIAIYLLQYRHITFEPWIFNTAWTYFHWFCYFLAISILPYAINVLYIVFQGGARFFQYMGKYSYEIFIFQMLMFYFFPQNINKLLYLILTTLLSIIPVVVYKYIRTKYYTKNIKE